MVAVLRLVAVWLAALAVGSAHGAGLVTGGGGSEWRFIIGYVDSSNCYAGPYGTDSYVETNVLSAATLKLRAASGGYVATLTGYEGVDEAQFGAASAWPLGTLKTFSGYVECKWSNGSTNQYSYATMFGKTAASTSCPANSTASGGSCVCNSGYLPTGGGLTGPGTGCQAAAIQCGARRDQLNSFAGTELGRLYTGTGSTPSTTVCEGLGTDRGGCSLKGTVAFGLQGGGSVVDGPFSLSSPVDCAIGSDVDAPALVCPTGQVPGTVGGNPACVPATQSVTSSSSSASAPAGAASAPASRVTDSAGNSLDVPPGGSTQSSTTCNGSACSTTTTVYNSSGVAVGSLSSTTPKDSFCAENPETTICKSSSFSGSCAGSFACDGDAVQCAIARDQHVRNCTLFDSTHADATGGLTTISDGNAATGPYGTAIGTPGNPLEVDVGGMMAAGPGNSYSSACPADIVYTTSFGVITIPLASACPALQLAGQIAVAFTLLSSALMLARGFAT